MAPKSLGCYFGRPGRPVFGRFSKYPHEPILTFWILNLNIIMCQNQGRLTVIHFLSHSLFLILVYTLSSIVKKAFGLPPPIVLNIYVVNCFDGLWGGRGHVVLGHQKKNLLIFEPSLLQ